MIDILFGRNPFWFDGLVGVCARSPLDVLVGLVATLLVGLSTVLATRPWTQGFEFSLSAILTDQDSADEVGV